MAEAERRYDQAVIAVQRARNAYSAAESNLIRAEREKREARRAMIAAAQEPNDASE